MGPFRRFPAPHELARSRLCTDEAVCGFAVLVSAVSVPGPAQRARAWELTALKWRLWKAPWWSLLGWAARCGEGWGAGPRHPTAGEGPPISGHCVKGLVSSGMLTTT